jgi:CheY-like chemotaxis protein
MAGKVFCKSCQVEVEPISVSMGTEGVERLRCPECGSFLDAEPDEFKAALQESEEFVFTDESISVPIFPSIFLVGYPEQTALMLEDQIIQRNLAREVVVLPNGEDLIIRLIQSLSSLDGEEIGLIITEVPMPYINGINTAIAVRAIEKTYPGHSLIPILFITRKPCDDTFKKAIRFLSPARYASLGSSDDSGQMAPRLNKIVALLCQEKW